MQCEPKWLVLYALSLEAEERGAQEVSDALMRRALDAALESDSELAAVAKELKAYDFAKPGIPIQVAG